jgi:PQQ-like domain
MRHRIGPVTQIALAALVLAAPGWGNVGNDSGRTANSPGETSITPDAARHLKVRWHTNLGRTAPPPVAAGGRVFALANVGTAGDELRAYAGSNGGCTAPGTCPPIWSVRQPRLDTLVLAGGQVQAGGADFVYNDPRVPFPHFLYYGGSYDSVNGARRAAADTYQHLPATTNNCVYGWVPNFVFSPTIIYTSLVRRGVAGACTNATIKTYQSVPAPFAVVANQVFELRGSTVHVMVDAENHCVAGLGCDELWDAHLSAPAAFDALPTVARGRLFVPTLDGTINVFSTSGCGQLDCSPAYRLRAGTVHVGSLAVTDTRVFAASDDGHLSAFRPAGCGAAVCEATWTANLGTPLHSPSVAGDVVYVPSDDGRVFAVDARGCGTRTCAALGSAATGARIRWAPVVSGGRVYVLNDAGDLSALGGG